MIKDYENQIIIFFTLLFGSQEFVEESCTNLNLK